MTMLKDYCDERVDDLKVENARLRNRIDDLERVERTLWLAMAKLLAASNAAADVIREYSELGEAITKSQADRTDEWINQADELMGGIVPLVPAK